MLITVAAKDSEKPAPFMIETKWKVIPVWTIENRKNTNANIHNARVRIAWRWVNETSVAASLVSSGLLLKRKNTIGIPIIHTPNPRYRNAARQPYMLMSHWLIFGIAIPAKVFPSPTIIISRPETVVATE